MRVAAVMVMLALSACDGDPIAVLIEAQSPVPLDTLEVRVRSSAGVLAAPEIRTVDGQSIIRVAVELEDAEEQLLVHLLGRDAEGGLYAATRCYAVSAVIEDQVPLVGPLTAAVDADGDGFSLDSMATCIAPGGGPCTAHACGTAAIDCDDTDAATHPAATEPCGVDRNCDGRERSCPDADRDGAPTCGDVPFDGCDCNDDNAMIGPDIAEVCGDGIDQNCDERDPLCDRDGDGYPADVLTGGSPDCDDDNGAVNPGEEEVCTVGDATALDENCNGLVDELSSCAPDDLDRDGFADCAVSMPPCDCNDCDPAIYPGSPERCSDGVDQDCDMVDMPCPVGDTDMDGFASVTMGGSDCDDTDAAIFPGAIERCENTITESCAGDVSCAADSDMDGFVEPARCEMPGVELRPGLDDVCDGLDNDCDAWTDETFSSDRGCVVTALCGGSCEVTFADDLEHCGGCRVRCNDTSKVADSCAAGACRCSTEGPGGSEGPACAGGQTCCATASTEGCRNLGTDPDSCGSCDTRCNTAGLRPSADGCTAGTCSCGGGAECAAGTICCGGACIDPTVTPDHCGGCGQACGLGETCRTGTCACGSLLDDGDADGRACASNKDCCGSPPGCAPNC